MNIDQLLFATTAMMIAGVITTKDVLLHSPTIVHDFGLCAWLNCWKAVLTNRRATFLELMAAVSRAVDLVAEAAAAAAFVAGVEFFFRRRRLVHRSSFH